MQKIPSLYGFSIITLVLVLMVINHFVYLRILESSVEETKQSTQSEVQTNGSSSDVMDEEESENGSADGASEGLEVETDASLNGEAESEETNSVFE